MSFISFPGNILPILYLQGTFLFERIWEDVSRFMTFLSFLLQKFAFLLPRGRLFMWISINIHMFSASRACVLKNMWRSWAPFSEKYAYILQNLWVLIHFRAKVCIFPALSSLFPNICEEFRDFFVIYLQNFAFFLPIGHLSKKYMCIHQECGFSLVFPAKIFYFLLAPHYLGKNMWGSIKIHYFCSIFLQSFAVLVLLGELNF